MKLLAAALGLAVSASAGHAADFIVGSSLPDQCSAMISGRIAPGDANKFGTLIDSGRMQNGSGGKGYLCLDSPGGSVPEALKIIDQWSGPTMLPARSVCESACALIFMSGSWYLEGGVGTVTDRWMHVTARLGFHAPDLVVPAQQYNEVAVKSAYALSLTTISQILRRNEALHLANTLMVEMLDTPPEQMFHIDTVDKAARWGIEIFGVDPVQRVEPYMAMNACLNASTEAYLTGADETLTLSPFNVGNAASIEAQNGTIRATVGFGVNDGGMWECSFDYRPQADPMIELDGRGFQGPAVTGRITPALFHAPGTPLARIAQGQPPQAYGPNNSFDTKCFVLSGETLLDEQSCAVQESYRLDAALTPSVTQEFTWPSGARTVVTSMDGGYMRARINGQATDYAAPASIPYDAWCLKNQSSGNTFCYLPDPSGGVR